MDDIIDPDRDNLWMTLLILTGIKPVPLQVIVFFVQHQKRISFRTEKCELLKINCTDNDGFKVNGIGIKVAESAR